MNRRLPQCALAMILATALTACAGNKPVYQPEPFTAAPMDTAAYVPGVDAFAIVLDSSSSMAEQRSRNFFAAKNTVDHLNKTIPELGYQGALATFGPGCDMNKGLARVWYGPETYSTADLAGALGEIECAGGVSPMNHGIEAGGGPVAGGSGKLALIVVSDFRDIDSKDALGAIGALNETAGGRLCFHGVQVGTNADGAELRDALAGATDCGSSVTASEIASAPAMSDYVRRILLTAAPAAPTAPTVADADGDGVMDDKDRCPDTPAGANVNRVGCWWVGADDLLFDFDKAEIKSTFMLDAAIDVLEQNPDVKVEVQGHTDSVGDPDYNMGLSERRAKAVYDYMLAKGMPASRMRVKGYGATKPHFSNDSEQGRALNRRVELQPYR